MSPMTLLVERRTAGLTQGELARRAGICRVRISQFERGHMPITPEKAVKLARALSEANGAGADPRTGRAA